MSVWDSSIWVLGLLGLAHWGQHRDSTLDTIYYLLTTGLTGLLPSRAFLASQLMTVQLGSLDPGPRDPGIWAPEPRIQGPSPD